jgi:hypothetical protein
LTGKSLTEHGKRSTEGEKSLTECVKRSTDGVERSTERVKWLTEGMERSTEGMKWLTERESLSAALIAPAEQRIYDRLSTLTTRK